MRGVVILMNLPLIDISEFRFCLVVLVAKVHSPTTMCYKYISAIFYNVGCHENVAINYHVAVELTVLLFT